MNHINRRIKQATEAFPTADTHNNEFVLQIEGSRGRCLFEARNPDLSPEVLLVAMPKKFQNLIWIRKGSFVIVQKQQQTCTPDALVPDAEGASNKKIFGEICHVLGKKQIEYLKQQNQWPTSALFNPALAAAIVQSASDDSDQSDASSEEGKE